MNTCPCCSHPLLRHISHHRLYWFCSHCWQEMPTVDTTRRQPVQELERLFNLPTVSSKTKLVSCL
ncbi:hypothetical protein [Coleofasciculus chthonoplastes]|uniref:hypothetical protein n=1 Tax=Coleofasciculus chthonoplastes TaxID=64178 RepID=UPI0032F8950A